MNEFAIRSVSKESRLYARFLGMFFEMVERTEAERVE